MAKLNMASIKLRVAQDQSGRMKAAAEQRAFEVFSDAVIGMQVEFEDHPVTREIAGGIDSPNLSGTLGGNQYAPKSLFAFIGFPKGDKPLDPIRDALSPDDPAGPKLSYSGKGVRNNNASFSFQISAPNKQAIYKRTPMPWASGWSWAQKVETRIPGFSRFMARFMPDASDAKSRSKGGTQVKQNVRGGEYMAPAGGYLSGIFANFLAQVKSYNKGGLRRRF